MSFFIFLPELANCFRDTISTGGSFLISAFSLCAALRILMVEIRVLHCGYLWLISISSCMFSSRPASKHLPLHGNVKHMIVEFLTLSR